MATTTQKTRLILTMNLGEVLTIIDMMLLMMSSSVTKNLTGQTMNYRHTILDLNSGHFPIEKS